MSYMEQRLNSPVFKPQVNLKNFTNLLWIWKVLKSQIKAEQETKKSALKYPIFLRKTRLQVPRLVVLPMSSCSE